MFGKMAQFTVVVLAALLITGAAGCGDDRTVTVSLPEGLENIIPGAYDTTPESTSQLLRDASAKIRANTSANLGVHFVMDSRTTSGGLTAVSRGEGDMVFPDKVKMTTQNYTGTQTVPVDVIAVDGKIYTRSEATGGVWKSSGGDVATPNPESITGLIDYTRSSRNFGEETLKGDRKTYHVQLDIDTALAANEAKKKNTDPAMIQSLEATRGSSVTVDLWIGTGDLLIYQERVVVSNPATALTSDQTFIFSGWGRPVEITRPCEAC